MEKKKIMGFIRDNKLQELCRCYLSKLRYMAKKHGVGEWVENIIIANKRKESVLCKNKYIVVDFYLPNHNTIIEYNGKQHYQPVDLWGGEEKLESQQERDIALRQYCKEHKIKLIEIPFSRFDDIELILSKKLKIKNAKHE